MRHLGPWQCLAGLTLLYVANSQATVYEINSTSDPVVEVRAVDADNMEPWDATTDWEVTVTPSDGRCSLREAVFASNYRIPIDGCEAGTGSDTAKLKEDTTYLLEQGNLSIGNGERIIYNYGPDPDNAENEIIVSAEIRDQAAQFSITIQLDSFEDPEEKVRPVISAGNNSRLFVIDDGGALVLANVELIDGDTSGPQADSAFVNNGGLVYAMGPVVINSNVRLAGGSATNGGAIYLTEGSDLAFRNGGLFENNEASQWGAVIATSDTFDGNIIGYDFYMASNVAGNSGVIYLDGGVPAEPAVEDNSQDPPVEISPAVPGLRIGLELGNGTMTGNSGGAINIVSENYASVLVNMTIAFNAGVALTMAETVFNVPEEAETTDHILHTVMVGNSGGACAGAGLDGTAVNPDAAARFLFTITDDANCPVPEEQTLGTPVTNNPNGAQADVFLGTGRVPCSGTGFEACTPMAAEEIDGPYPAFLPNPLPAAVELDPMAASLFDRGNPENVAVDPCESTDNRGKSRGGPGGRCDVGAIEFLRAQAQPEEIDLISGKSVLGDVVANDLNDTVIDCYLLEDIVVNEGTCTVGDTVCIDQAILDRCLTVVEPPERGIAVPVIDANGYPRIRYTPDSSFHGVDQIRYQVDKDAFEGGTDLGQNQNDITNFFAAPATGLTEKKSITDESIGALGGLMTMLLIAAGFLRRSMSIGRRLVAMMAVLVAGQAMAVDITVNSLADDVPPIKNDGNCTLREALLNAAEAGSPDCAYGGSSTDTILLPAGVIQLSAPLVIEGGGVEIVGKGAREDDTDDEETLTRILGVGEAGGEGFRLFEVQPPNPSSGYPAVRFQFLTLEQGYAIGDGTDGAGSGGVIISGGTVIFDRVRIIDNYAQANGGVAFIRSNAGNEKLLTFNRSFISNNSAGISGGVMSSTAQNGETFRVAVIDSTFDSNTAAVEGGVLDANIRVGDLQVANSTFVNNDAPKGSALDLSGMTINANIMNSSFMNNTGGTGIDLGDAETETRMGNTAYFNSGDSCSSGATILHESEFNAYSGIACEASTVSTSDQSGTGSASLESAIPTPLNSEGTSDDYVPPYLPIVDPENDGVLVNMGNDDETLISGTGSALLCRAEDLRGISRTSGGRCDVGAFEYQQITAEDDEGNNQFTPARKVPVDILANDLPSDGAEFALLTDVEPIEFLHGTFEFEHAELVADSDPEEFVGTDELYDQDTSLGGDPTVFTLNNTSNASMLGATIQFVWLYYSEDRDGYDLKCGDPIPSRIIKENPDLFEEGDIADECVVLFTPPDNAEFDSRVCTSTSEEPLKIAFRYTFEDSEGISVADGDAGTAVMTIKDKAPTLKSQSVLNQPGKKVVFKLVVTDEDHPDAVIDWSRYNVSVATEPSFAKKNADGEVLGVGLFIDDESAGTVTYVPDSNYNTFKDTFTLKVEDTDCNVTSQQVRFTVRYNNEETSAAAGSVSWMMLAGLLLLLRRRFAA